MNIFKYLIFVVLFSSLSFACTLCKLEVPVVVVEVDSYEEEKQRYFDVKWVFEREFSTSTLLAYDINGDNKPDEKELQEVKLSLEDYLKLNGFLTHISLKKENEELKKIDFEVVGSKIEHENYKLIYTYRIKTDIKLDKIAMLELKFFDEKEFFDFVFKRFRFKEYKGIKTDRKKTSIIKYFDENLQERKIEQTDEQIKQDSNSILEPLKIALKNLKEYITDLLTDIKDNNTLSSYVWLLLFSFAYGVIHALGPGHGKSLVASYFLSKDGSVFKALNISLMIGVVHTFSAFLLTFTIYYILKSVLSEYFSDVESVAIKASAVVIILIALYLISKKLKKPKLKSFSVATDQNFVKIPNQHIDSTSCGCSACKTDSTDVGVILAAGIIPCPGTITIFIFTFGLGIYFVGLLSAIWMSLGMSFIIFLAAYLSIKVKNKTNSNPTIKKVLEYGSLVFILSLGLMLLLF